jgi:non-heme chloroperoxidase
MTNTGASRFPHPVQSMRVALILALLLAACAPHRVPPNAGWVPASVAAEHRITTSDGVRLRYLDAGRGRPIVLVPGWAMPADIWEPQLRGLADRYRVIALDPRAQGWSEASRDGLFHARRADDLHDLIEALGLRDVTLVGWSLAVPELLSYVERHGTGRLAGVVLVDGGVWGPPVDAGSRHAAMAELQRDPADYFARFVRGMYATPQSTDYLARVTAAARRTPTDAAMALYFDLYFGPERDRRAALAGLDRPTLYVSAGRPSAHADTLRAHVRQARAETFVGAGHALFVDDAPRFNALLDAFVRAEDVTGARP